MIKDSGKRESYGSGMVRDVTDGKVKYDLMIRHDVPFKQQMFYRWGQILTEGVNKYGLRNWELANSVEEVGRFQESAFRHFIQWLNGETDEDHAAAVFFNINAFETTKAKLVNEKAVKLIGEKPLETLADRYANEVYGVARKQTHNERDVKLQTFVHSPADHGPEFFSSACPEKVCTDEAIKMGYKLHWDNFAGRWTV